RVRHTEARAGELDGKAYKEVRHYATLTLPVPAAPAAAPPAQDVSRKPRPAAAADPAATQLLADARAARAVYPRFPGFTADAEITRDGGSSGARARVTRGGKATTPPGGPRAAPAGGAGPEEAQRWAQRLLGSIVAHRLDSGPDTPTPCCFID